MKETVTRIRIETEGGEDLVRKVNDGVNAAKSLKQQLREATIELQNMSDIPGMDPAKIQAQAKAVGELKDKIKDANDMAKSFAGNKFENMASSLRGVKDGLLSMDFEKMSNQAKIFAANASKITFKDGIKSLKMMGQTFVSLGSSLLKNPLFLIPAAIIAISIAIYKLLDSLGIIKKAMDALGKVVDILKEKWRQFVDLFSKGQATKAYEMQQESKALDELATKVEKTNAEKIKGLDNEIRMMKLSGQNTDDVEKEKQRLIKETALERYKADVAAYNAAINQMKKDDEEIKKLKEKLDASKSAYKQAAADEKYLIEEQKKAAKEKAKADAEAAKQKKKAADDAHKQEISDRLNVTRLIEDLKIDLMNDGVEKELELNRTKYDRLIEDLYTNETIKADERLKLIDLYTKQQSYAEEKIKDDAAKKELEKQKDLEKEKNDITLKYMEEGVEKEKALRVDQYNNELLELKKALDDKLITQDVYNNLIKQSQENLQEDLIAIDKKAADEKKRIEQEVVDAKIQGVMMGLDIISNLTELFAGKSKEQQKKAFNIQKGIQIAQTTIDTIRSAQGAFTSFATAPALQELAPLNLILGGIAAAAATTAGLLNVKKIAETEFDENGGGTGKQPSIPKTSMGTGQTNQSQLPVGLYGQMFKGSTGTKTQETGQRQVGSEIRAYVVESDITSTQKRVNKYKQLSEIG